MRLTKSWRLLIEAAQEAAAGELWEPIKSDTLRYAEWGIPTPDGTPSNWWPFAEYDRFVFLTFFPGSSIILGVSPAPWVGRQDREITQRLAKEILEDPTKAFNKN